MSSAYTPGPCFDIQCHSLTASTAASRFPNTPANIELYQRSSSTCLSSARNVLRIEPSVSFIGGFKYSSFVNTRTFRPLLNLFWILTRFRAPALELIIRRPAAFIAFLKFQLHLAKQLPAEVGRPDEEWTHVMTEIRLALRAHFRRLDLLGHPSYTTLLREPPGERGQPQERWLLSPYITPAFIPEYVNIVNDTFRFGSDRSWIGPFILPSREAKLRSYNMWRGRSSLTLREF